MKIYKSFYAGYLKMVAANYPGVLAGKMRASIVKILQFLCAAVVVVVVEQVTQHQEQWNLFENLRWSHRPPPLPP